MLILKSMLHVHKLSFCKVNTRQNGFIFQRFLKFQCLSHSSSLRACLYTKTKFHLQPLASFGSGSFHHRHLTQDPGGLHLVPRHKADKIHKNYKLIYSNGIVRYYRATQFFLYPITMIGAVSSVYLMWANFEDFSQKTVDVIDHPFVAGCTFFAACSIMMTIFVKICRQAILRIYTDPQTGHYVAIRYPWNFLNKQIVFTKNDVDVGRSGQLLPFNRSNIKIKGQPFLIVGRDFITPHEYNSLIGKGNQKWYEEEEQEEHK